MNLNELFEKSKKELFFILGPCVLESLDLALHVGEYLAKLKEELGISIVFKSSFDKANRSSIESFRGPGLTKGIQWLFKVKEQTGLPVITDIHTPEQAKIVKDVVDVIQIPAFLCRQTDLLIAAGNTQKIINVKKGQFMAPWDMQNAVDKIKSTGNQFIWLTERGTCFGYNNLVVDFKSIPIMQKTKQPVVFDATHSVQLPGGLGRASGGQREFIPILAKAAVAAGCNGIFMEVHPNPDKALCDGPNSLFLDHLKDLLKTLLKIKEVTNVGLGDSKKH